MNAPVALQVCGALFLVKVALKVLKCIKSRLLSKTYSIQKSGEWAVVTGCTSGIGKALAEKLAKKGMNVVLVARNKPAAEQIAGDIEQKYKVKTRVIDVDFATAGPADYARVIGQINEVPEVGVLVNNVGIGYDHPEYFLDVSIDVHRTMLDVNIRSMVEMTHGVLPKMVERKKGIIINVGSVSGLVPTPFLSTYAASKAFVDSFSLGLNGEYKAKGILVQGLAPGPVVSKLSKVRRPDMMTPSPEAYADMVLGSLRQARSNPYWVHRIMVRVMKHFPGVITKQLLGLRAKALKKKKQG